MIGVHEGHSGGSRDEVTDAVLRVRAGEPAAAALLDALVRPRLTRYFASGPWPADEAEDLVQKTLGRVFHGVERLEHPERFLPWLFAIARNVRATAAGRWRARAQVEAGGLELAREPPAPREDARQEEDELRAQREAALSVALGHLPARQRQCLLLHVREEMSYEEIAATLRLSAHTVRNHIAQAKESLRRLVGTTRDGAARR